MPPKYAMHDYRELYKGLAEHYRLWIYNGQDDGCIPYVGAQASPSHSLISVPSLRWRIVLGLQSQQTRL